MLTFTLWDQQRRIWAQKYFAEMGPGLIIAILAFSVVPYIPLPRAFSHSRSLFLGFHALAFAATCLRMLLSTLMIAAHINAKLVIFIALILALVYAGLSLHALHETQRGDVDVMLIQLRHDNIHLVIAVRSQDRGVVLDAVVAAMRRWKQTFLLELKLNGAIFSQFIQAAAAPVAPKEFIDFGSVGFIDFCEARTMDSLHPVAIKWATDEEELFTEACVLAFLAKQKLPGFLEQVVLVYDASSSSLTLINTCVS